MSAATVRSGAISSAPSDLPYRLAWRSRTAGAGSHRTPRAGAGGLFRDLASFLEHPDPRRIDVRRSLSDPFDTLYVRRFEQTGPIDVVMIVDISGSMSFKGRTNKFAIAAEIAGVLARSARRIGDRFGLVACSGEAPTGLSFPCTRSRAGEGEMISAVECAKATGSGVGGLIDAAAGLTGRRRLVVLVSDFQFSLDAAAEVFAALDGHDVVPIILRDSAELDDLPTWGLLSLSDLETGRQRLVAMRPSLKKAWKAQDELRRDALDRIAAMHGRKMFDIADRVDWERLASYLGGGD